MFKRQIGPHDSQADFLAFVNGFSGYLDIYLRSPFQDFEKLTVKFMSELVQRVKEKRSWI